MFRGIFRINRFFATIERPAIPRGTVISDHFKRPDTHGRIRNAPAPPA